LSSTDLLKSAQDELSTLERLNESHAWFQAAYSKLSQFSGVEVLEDGKFRLLGSHVVSFSPSSLRMEPSDVYVGDLDPSTSSKGVCISEVIERLASFRDLADVASRLGWKYTVEQNAPIMNLIPSSGPRAVFALLFLPGMEDFGDTSAHPLVEWGEVDVDAFNEAKIPLVEKMRTVLEGMGFKK
jgi:hypothetical protein